MLNEKLKNAIELRIGLKNYLRAVKHIDDTVIGIKFSHTSSISNGKEMVDIWEKWRQLANCFQTVKDSSIDGKGGLYREDLVRRISGKLKNLFKETILEVLIETILLYESIDGIEVSERGFNLISLRVPDYRPNNYKRFYIPKEIIRKFNGDSSNPILHKDFVKEVLGEFTYEYLCFTKYLTVKDGIIFINT